MKRYVCVHGHFYQPPRENPWLEAIERQDSAHPYHDWNERITDECYGPNSRSRMLDEERWITRIVNNYSRISFNFGPTLLSWLEAHAPDVYGAILEADRLSIDRFGHGSAMAQAYNHMIMPLANDRDRRTQTLWGVQDFEHRFGRKPEGMWLPETAADTASLEALVDAGIKFTILAPRQAKRFRPLNDDANGEWTDVSGTGPIDPSRAYQQNLPSGRSIALFFYDGPISQAVAFERLLHSGKVFAERLTDAFDKNRTWDQLAHIATDGESYGHHHRHGDMALAAALDAIEQREDIELINYGAFLEKHPPEMEVEIVEASSWSCVHGVGRWKEDCGCHTGGRPEWDQKWRAPLRESLDWLRDELAGAYEEQAGEILGDPWAARDEYIEVILNRETETEDAFFARHAQGELSEEDRVRLLELLEAQRHAMLMYTSCGWFFDELSGIETVQVIEYAGRAVQLAKEAMGVDLEDGFLDRLGEAQSNIPRFGTGRDIYERWVRAKMINLPAVAAHAAISGLFESSDEPSGSVYCFEAEQRVDHDLRSGLSHLRLGEVRLQSIVTRREARYRFVVVHFGDHNVSGGIRPIDQVDRIEAFSKDAVSAFRKGDYVRLFKMIEERFGPETYSLGSLFRDRQHDILDRLLDATLESVRGVYRGVYERHAPLLHFHTELDVSAPRELLAAAEIVLNAELREGLERAPEEIAGLHRVMDQVEDEGVPLDEATLTLKADDAVLRVVEWWRETPQELERLEALRDLLSLVGRFHFEVDRSRAQTAFYQLVVIDGVAPREDATAEEREAWKRTLDEASEMLRVRVPS